MNNNLEKFLDVIKEYNLSGDEVLKLLTDWHGTQLISDKFLKNLAECEGYHVDGYEDEED